MAEASKQIFLWFGDNDYEIAEKLKGWVKVFEKKYSNLNIIVFDFEEAKSKQTFLVEIKNALQVDSLFGINKLIVLKNFLSKKSKVTQEMAELIISALDKLSANFFVVFVEKEKPDAKSSLLKKIQSLEKSGQAEISEFIRPRQSELGKWIVAQAKKNNVEISPGAVNLMIVSVGNDLWQLALEMVKLANYKVGRIEEADVKLLVRGKYNDDIFALMDAISEKNKAKALKLFRDQLDGGANEMYLLTMLVRQFRILWQVKEALNKRALTSDALARELKIHPYVAKRSMIFAKNFSLEQLKALYGKLLEFDIKIKTSNTSFELLFDLLIARI